MTSATLNIGGRLRAAMTAAAVTACFALGAASNAHAATAPAAAAPAMKVSYGDLNLATEQGSLALYARLEHAARAVCPVDDIRDLHAYLASRACQAEAIARAVQEINSPTLASVYAERVHHS